MNIEEALADHLYDERPFGFMAVPVSDLEIPVEEFRAAGRRAVKLRCPGHRVRTGITPRGQVWICDLDPPLRAQ